MYHKIGTQHFFILNAGSEWMQFPKNRFKEVLIYSNLLLILCEYKAFLALFILIEKFAILLENFMLI